AAAIAEMRRRKQRPAKPFALMFPSLASLAEFDLTSAQIEALTRHEAPIILLEKPAQSSLAPGLADELPELGVMLPYAPLFARILTEASHPIVATSANVSHAPIVADEQQQTVLTALADLILHHNRPIISPQDDSVIRFSPKHQQRIILRRSRGIAPNFFGHKQKAELSLIAAGADMKSAFGILHEGQYYLSQYLGDLSHYDTQLRYQTVSAHLQEVLIHHPTAVLTDKHPEYISRRIGQDIGSRANLDVHDFFHHHAHFAAVMAEHDLFEQEKVIGVIWDGSGWGGNAELWGGEMFEWEKPFMQRLGHIQTFPNLAGDKMAREPRLCSFAMLNDEKDVRAKFTEKELKIYDRLIQNASLQSSSMGRLFDAAASVLDICQKQGFEGEAAMKLEGLGYAFWRQNQLLPEGYPMDYDAPVLDGRKLLLAMLQDRQEGQRIGEIALKFHVTLCQFVAHIARKHQAKHIAFSGGVFQNALLVDLMIDSLEKDFSLHFHEQLSPNDENIALGQMALYQLRLQNMYAEN
ncbi:MAG: Sua5/YciO/YrdC/YwlC family protein, partial [Bacteroidota bacterium]